MENIAKKSLEGTIASMSYTPKCPNFAEVHNVNIQFKQIAETFVILKPKNSLTIGQRLRIDYSPVPMRENQFFVLNYRILPTYSIFDSLNPTPLPPRDFIAEELEALE